MSVLLLISCTNSDGDNDDQRSIVVTTDDSSTGGTEELDVEDDSVPALNAYVLTLQALKTEADDQGESDFSSSINNVVTQYQFQVLPHLNSEEFRDASFDWISAENAYEQMKTAYEGVASVGNLSTLWAESEESRETLVSLNELWRVL